MRKFIGSVILSVITVYGFAEGENTEKDTTQIKNYKLEEIQIKSPKYNSNIFELPVSRKEIGEFIDMTTENVIRTLSEFRKDNIIKINGKIIEIIDLSRLMQICEFG